MIDQEQWRERLLARGFQLISETAIFAIFAQFSPADESTGLDLMFVTGATFEQFWTNSESKKFGATTAKVPSLDQLLAPKLHVLKQGLRRTDLFTHQTMRINRQKRASRFEPRARQ